MTVQGRFEIDDKGFKMQMSEVPLWRLVQEIISNSFDEKSVTKITCSIRDLGDDSVEIERGSQPVSKYKDRNLIQVEIYDDGEGFRDVRDIFTLYKDSYKRTNPNQAGRYNEGEKRFLAVALEGFVHTRDIEISFNGNQRKERKTRPRKGTRVLGIFEYNDSITVIKEQLQKVAVPENKTLIINTITVPPKVIEHKFKAELMTVKAGGANQKLVQIKRETQVRLYRKKQDEKPIIYELGIPVQDLEEDLQWHVDVRQKIPQTTDRNVISDKYLQKLFAVIAENVIKHISDEDSGANYLSDALKKTNEKTSKQIFKKRYGTEKVMIQSSDYRENERALEAGVHLVKSGELDSEVVSNLKDQGTLKYASQEFSTSGWEDAKHVEPTVDMLNFAGVCRAVARDVIDKNIRVNFVTTKHTDEIANYGGVNLQWNIRNCGGKKFFVGFSSKAIGILIHELAHDKLGNNDGHAHFSHDYIHEMERIAGLIGSKGIQYWVLKVQKMGQVTQI